MPRLMKKNVNMTELQTSIDRLLQGAVDRGDVPGVAAMVIDGAGRLYQGAFGERLLGGGVAMTLDTVVSIASITKTITATAAMQLVEQGRLSLDDPAAAIVPYLGEVEVLEGFDDKGAPILRPARTTLTLRHLLTHTAGFGYEIWNREYLDYQAAAGVPSLYTLKLAALNMPLLFDPGSRWNYGINIEWTGQMVEAVSGLRLGEYMRDHIFEPLGMASTGYEVGPEMAARQAAVHQRGPDGRLAPPDRDAPAPEPEFDLGGGFLNSTVEDYAKFMTMILNRGSCDGGQILSPETVAMMSVNQMGANRVAPLNSLVPPRSNDVEFLPGVEKGWGLSFMINLKRAPTGRSPGSLFWAGLSNSYFWIDPARNIAGIYSTQIFPFVDELSLPLYLDFEKAAYDAHFE